MKTCLLAPELRSVAHARFNEFRETLALFQRGFKVCAQLGFDANLGDERADFTSRGVLRLRDVDRRRPLGKLSEPDVESQP
jgi:hypothetical protein